MSTPAKQRAKTQPDRAEHERDRKRIVIRAPRCLLRPATLHRVVAPNAWPASVPTPIVVSITTRPVKAPT